MHIVSMNLKNFRNYENLEIDFHEHVNMIYGNNAQGKTNILEAVITGATTKSHKNAKDKEMIKIGEDESHIRIIISKKGILQRIDMHLKKNKGKGIAINGVPLRKSGELMGLLNVIFFSPEDLNIIKNGPDERRKFIDMELCQLNQVYFYNLSQYKKVLNQRNKLLKQIYYDNNLKATLPIWNEKLVEYGCKIIDTRESFINNLSVLLEEITYKLTGKKESINIKYKKNVDSVDFATMLAIKENVDLSTMTTNVGPHRDDIIFLNGDIDLKKYGSQGQQRTCALALKLAEIEIVKRVTGDNPVLLLDDVMSELDRDRQNFLLDNIKDIQTMITCTGLEEFINSSIVLDKTFYVKNGVVEEIK
ncbi:MAG: DNA replication/repair protein RecF [Lachnospiraceae bacterium]|nr:DNA replication/repair protein RecF [Lachnospiraceae bacterium]